MKNQSSSHQSSTSHQSEDNTYSQDLLNVLGSYPFDCPPGFKWVPAGWKHEPIQNQSNENEVNTSQPNSVQNTSFKELILDKVKPLKNSPRKKRRKIICSAPVISDPTFLQQLEDKEGEKEKGENLRKKKGAKCTEKYMSVKIAIQRKTQNMRTTKMMMMIVNLLILKNLKISTWMILEESSTTSKRR